MKVSSLIMNLVPYKAGKPIAETQREYGIEKVYKLASNENPLGPSPLAIAAIEKALSHQHRYPDPSQYEVLQAVSKKWNIPTNMLGVGNGSDELIDLLCRIFCEPGDGVLTSEAAFAAYPISAQANRAICYSVPMTQDLRFDVKALVHEFTQRPEKKIRLIFIANPNNPTGTYLNTSEMEYLFQSLGNRDDVLIVFDEAYNEFVRAEDYRSATSYLHLVKNLVVLKTFSKTYGLAGLRLGVMMTQPEYIEIFNRVRKPFNVNDLAQVAAVAALQDDDYIRRSRELTWKGLDYFYKKLEELGLPYIKSQANFVLFDTCRDANKVNEELLRRGIIMRPVGSYGFKSHLRLSIGLEEENQAAMKALGDVIKIIPATK